MDNSVKSLLDCFAMHCVLLTGSGSRARYLQHLQNILKQLWIHAKHSVYFWNCHSLLRLMVAGDVYISADAGGTAQNGVPGLLARGMDFVQGFKVAGYHKVERSLPVDTQLTIIGEVVNTEPTVSLHTEWPQPLTTPDLISPCNACQHRHHPPSAI